MKSFAERVNCHGFSDFFRAKKNHERIIWAVAIGLGICMLLYLVAYTATRYLEYPIATSISHRAVPQLKFPDVYICPAERINSSKVDPYTEDLLKMYAGEPSTHMPTTTSKKPNDEETAIPPAFDAAGLSLIATTPAQETERGNLLDETGDDASSMVELSDEPGLDAMRAGTEDLPPPMPAMPVDDMQTTAQPKATTTLATTTTKKSILEGDTAGSLTDVSQVDEFFISAVSGEVGMEDQETETLRKRRAVTSEEYERYRMMYETETYKDMNMRIGIDLEKFLTECAFQGKRVACRDIALEMLDVKGGKCFLVNPRQAQTTAGSGLSVVIRHTENNRSKSLLRSGPWARIHDTFDPFSTQKVRLFGPGTVVNIRMSVIRTFLLNSMHSKDKRRCNEGQVDYSVYNVRDTKASCDNDCYQDLLFRNCGCLAPVDDVLLKEEAKSYPFCMGDLLTNCVDPLIREQQQRAQANRIRNASEDTRDAEGSSGNKTEYQKCLGKCWQPCKVVDIATDVTYGRSSNMETGGQDSIIVDIFFGELQVMEVHDVYSFPLANLLSDLGKFRFSNYYAAEHGRERESL